MVDWWSDILKAVIGAGLGSGTVTLWLNRSKKKADSTYLAMRLAVHLEDFSSACCDLIFDNRNAHHHPEQRLPDWQANLPKLADYPDDGDGWKALQIHLAGRCLELRNRIKERQSGISQVIEYHDDDIEDAVAEACCDLGLEAWEIASKLRTKYGLNPFEPGFNYPGQLAAEREKHEEALAEREVIRLESKELARRSVLEARIEQDRAL